MTRTLTIAALRSDMGLTQSDFGSLIGISSIGHVSTIERENRCALAPALRIEEISGGRIDAADLNEDVRAARAACRHGCTDIATTLPASSGENGDCAGAAAGDFPDGGRVTSMTHAGSEAGAEAMSPSAPVERAA